MKEKHAMQNQQGNHESVYSIKIHTGQKVYLQAHRNQQRYHSKIVGVERYEFTICKLPVLAGSNNIFSSGSGLTVRYKKGGTVYGFNSRIIECITKPIPLIVMTYPRKIETVELRSNIRVQCMLPAKASCGENYNFGCFVRDISMCGCRLILTGHDVDKVGKIIMDNDILDVNIDVATLRKHTFRVLAKSHNKMLRSLTVGCSFIFSDGHQPALSNFVNSLSMAAFEDSLHEAE